MATSAIFQSQTITLQSIDYYMMRNHHKHAVDPLMLIIMLNAVFEILNSQSNRIEAIVRCLITCFPHLHNLVYNGLETNAY